MTSHKWYVGKSKKLLVQHRTFTQTIFKFLKDVIAAPLTFGSHQLLTTSEIFTLIDSQSTYLPSTFLITFFPPFSHLLTNDHYQFTRCSIKTRFLHFNWQVLRKNCAKTLISTMNHRQTEDRLLWERGRDLFSKTVFQWQNWKTLPTWKENILPIFTVWETNIASAWETFWLIVTLVSSMMRVLLMFMRSYCLDYGTQIPEWHSWQKKTSFIRIIHHTRNYIKITQPSKRSEKWLFM